MLSVSSGAMSGFSHRGLAAGLKLKPNDALQKSWQTTHMQEEFECVHNMADKHTCDLLSASTLLRCVRECVSARVWGVCECETVAGWWPELEQSSLRPASGLGCGTFSVMEHQ